MATPVRADRTKTLLFIAYLVIVSFVGCTVGGLSAYFRWGFCGFSIAGLLLLTGPFGLLGMLIGGGSWNAACPSCGKPMASGDYEGQRKEAKVLHCKECGAWVHGRTTLEVVPADHVHATAVFEAPLPDRFAWPDGCPVCAEPTTRTITVKGRSATGTVAVAAAGGIQQVLVIEAPACARHDDGVTAARGDGKGDRVLFRSHAYWTRFVAANPA